MNESQFILLLLGLDNQELESMLFSNENLNINTFNIINGIISFRKIIINNKYTIA